MDWLFGMKLLTYSIKVYKHICTNFVYKIHIHVQ